MEENNPFDPINLFAPLLLHPRHRDLSQEAYKRFPKKIKKRLQKYHVMLCDWFYRAKYPELRIPDMPFGFYNTKSNLIDIIPEESKHLSDKGFIGFIAHEVAHAIINNSFCPIKKKVFEIQFNKLPQNLRKFYRTPEDLHANWLAKKWDFVEEIDIMNKERVISK